MLPANVRRHFLPWHAPLLPQAVNWLADGWKGGEPLDLGATLVVVPTRQSGRRLREALAAHTAAHGQAVFPPHVATPDSLLAENTDQSRTATRLECLLAWTDVLQALDFADVPDVFPEPPARRDFGWAWRLAETFFRLQTQLTEAGLDFAAVAARAGVDQVEAERWRQLAGLEAQQVRRLGAMARKESHAARRDFAQCPEPPAGVGRVVILAAPDPLPLACTVLARWARDIAIDLVIYAPAEEATAFDDWGRPRPEHWSQRVLALPRFEEHVHLCADPAAEAAQAAAMAATYQPQPDGVVALGVADPEVLPLLANELTRAGVAAYNPESPRRGADALHALLTALAAVARDAPFEAVAALARCPDFLACLEARLGSGFSAAKFLRELDDARARHLPADLEALRRVAEERRSAPASSAGEAPADARRWPQLARGLAVLEELRALLHGGDFFASVLTTLRAIFAERRFDLSRDEDVRAVGAAEAWSEVVRDCAGAAKHFTGLGPTDWWQVALRLFAESRRTEDKPAGALDLQGWLELLWEDAPHLVVAGCNDGLVPDAILGDPFLPENWRERLGLKTNAARFARDAYLLQAIAAWRGAASTRAGTDFSRAVERSDETVSGRLDLLFAKTSAAGDPLRPSRVLLRCAEAELPARIAWLFRPVEAARAAPAWTRTWKLQPRVEPPPSSVAVTGLRAWLECPFRFYLGHVLKVESVDPAKSELDARDFGTLCHAALEALAGDGAMRDSTDEAALRAFLLARFDAAARQRFGDDLTLPLLVQLESARQRLGRAATVQARLRAEGWVIERAEWKFALDLGGLAVRGKIDRIDRHEASGARRVIDYKTSDTAVSPHKAHLRPFRAGDERLPEWRRVALGDRELVWTDLQLPVYLRALTAAGMVEPADTAYFNLPKAVGETALAPWTELTPGLLAAAEDCADGVTAAIRAGEFWPPAEIPADDDDFASLFHHGAEDSVVPLERPHADATEPTPQRVGAAGETSLA